MRTLIYLSLLIFIPICTSAHHGAGKQSIFGNWSAESTRHRIKIKDWRHGIKAKDSYSNDWRRYHRVGRHLYKSDCGSVIRIVGRNSISFRSRKGIHREMFYREGHRRNAPRYEVPRYHDYNLRHEKYYNGTFDHNRDRFRNRTTRNIEGRYRNISLGHDIIILQDRNGIKTRIDGETKWFYYNLGKARANQYIDRLGNRIVLTSGNSLKWIGNNGNSYKLQKLSNDPF